VSTQCRRFGFPFVKDSSMDTIITSRANPLIVETAKLSDKKYRDANRLFFFEGWKLFDEAQKVTAEQPELFRRVRLARLPLIYTQVSLNDRLPDEARKTEANAQLAREFIEIVEKEGITHHYEGPGGTLIWGQTCLSRTQK